MNVENIALQLVNHLGDAAVRAVAVAIPCGLMTLIVRRRAALCHAIWTAMLAGMLALPLLRPLAPPARIEVRSAPVLAMFGGPVKPVQPLRLPPLPAPADRVTPAHSWQFWAAIVYACGFLLLAARLLGGVVLTHRLVGRAARVDGVIGESSDVRVPLTAGYLAPRILLPLDWRTWNDATREAVLAHETAHVRRRDGLVNLAAAMNTCIFWFHPLAWWLERRLAVLAEHAADDVAMASCGDAKEYAATLLSMASSLNRTRGRLVWGSVGMQGGRITERIHRILSGNYAARLPRFAGMLACSTVAVAVWLAGTLQLQRAAFAQEGRIVPAMARLTPGQVAELERAHAANPDDEKLTQRLLVFYRFNHREQERAQLVFWLIDNHPESQLHRSFGGALFGRSNEDDAAQWRANYDEAKRRWAVQVARHPDDPNVLGNAAGNLADEDFATQVDYLRRAQKLDAKNWTDRLAMLYSSILRTKSPAAMSYAPAVRSLLDAESDADVILTTVRFLVQFAGQSVLGGKGNAAEIEEVRSLTMELLNRAEQLRPGSQSVVELREGVRQLGTTLMGQQSDSQEPSIRVGGMVQKANLVSAPPPVYPADAKARGVEGVVSLQVRINKEGLVDFVSVVSGDPSLIDAALAAVKQYVYKPTKLNGAPVAVMTTVDVPFHLQ